MTQPPKHDRSAQPGAATVQYTADLDEEQEAKAPLLAERTDVESGRAASPPPSIALPRRRHRFPPLLGVALVAVAYSLAAAAVYCTAPPLSPHVRQDLRFPRSAAQVKKLAHAAQAVAKTHSGTVTASYALAYTFLQTFCVPGSLFMTVLGGALFPLPLAILLVTLCTTAGATAAYLMSEMFGAPLISRMRCLRVRVGAWATQLAEHRDGYFAHLVFLRVAPIVPNWLINLASPHLHVPLSSFAGATAVGAVPPAFVYGRLGHAVKGLTDDDFSVLNPLNVAAIALMAVLAAVPIIAQWWRRRQADREALEEERVSVLDGADERPSSANPADCDEMRALLSKPASRAATPSK